MSRDRVLRRDVKYPWIARESIAYAVIPGRDVAAGHAMIFARFCHVMDFAEYIFLTDHVELSLGELHLAEYKLREREIYYFNNAYAGDTIDIAVKVRVTEEMDGDGHRISVETEYQLFRHSNLDILAVAYAKKETRDVGASRIFSTLIPLK